MTPIKFLKMLLQIKVDSKIKKVSQKATFD